MKEIKLDIPEEYEIDKENSTFDCIRLKKKSNRWRDTEDDDNHKDRVEGFYINQGSSIKSASSYHTKYNRNIFSTEKQAKSALAMAQISQIMANDERFGGVVTDEEWNCYSIEKYSIERKNNKIIKNACNLVYTFLAFHATQQRDLFLEENEDLVKQYLMID